MTDATHHFETRAVHAGAEPDPTTKARITPIYQTASYVFDDADHAANLFALKEFGNIYTRIMNPTQAALEGRIANLEGGTAALAVASGHAAQFLTLHTILRSGDEFIAAKQLYGGSINQFKYGFEQFNWQVKWADIDDISSFEAAITEKTRAIHIESLANPSGRVTDIEAIAKIAQKHNLPLIVDNTLATPYLIRPFEYGANIVVHSLTKFLGGHGNSIGGIIVDGGTFNWSDERYPALSKPRPEYGGAVLADAFPNMAFALGARVFGLRDIGPAIAPFNAFLILTGIETLALRMEKHVQNAQKVAEYLENHDKVSWVNYAGLKSNKDYAKAQKYTPKGAGAIFTFGVKGGDVAGRAVVSNVKIFSHVANIGDTRSLIIHPASTTHSQLSEDQKITAGAGPDVVRVSIGIEDADDLINDLEQALNAT